MNILEALLNAQGGNAVQELGQQFGLNGGQAQSAIEALLPSLAGAVNQNMQSPGGLEALMGALAGGGHSRYVDQPGALGDPAVVNDGNGILGHLFGDKQVSREVAARASAQTGIGADILKKMLPIVAAMVMGSLAKRASQDGMFGGAQQAPVGADPQAGGLGDVLGSVLGGGGQAGGLGGVLGNVLGGALGGGNAGAGQAGGLGGVLGNVLGGALGGGGRAAPAGGAGGLVEMLTPMLDKNRNGSALDEVLGMAAGFLRR